MQIKVNRNLVLGIFLIGAICVNTYVHITSPAYKYYRDVCEDLKNSNQEFRRRIADEFIPSLYMIASNRSVVVESPQNNFNPFKVDGLPRSLGIIDGSYFEVGQSRGFVWEGRIFKVGDDFYGFPIVGISPTIVTTAQGTFYIQTPPYYSDKNGGVKNDK